MIRALLSPLCALVVLPVTALIAQDATPPAPAAPPTATTEPVARLLQAGDPAPALQCGEWVQGDAVKEFEKGKVYVLEFWATWCGPCKTAIPHLNDLHKKYQDKGLVVIGQNCGERDEAKVKPFLQEMGDKMTYRVALDDKSKSKDGAMSATWMRAAGRNGIPCSFVVGTEGKLLWIGHPMQLTEPLVEEMLANKFDAEAVRAKQEKEQAAAMAVREQITAVTKAVREKNWDEAAKAVDELAAIVPEAQKPIVPAMKLDIAVGRGDVEGALAQAQAVVASVPEQNRGIMQANVARRLIAAETPDPKLLQAALAMATEACAGKGSKNVGAFLTLADIQEKMGRKDEAASSLGKAVELAPDQLKPRLQKRLDALQGKGGEPQAPAAGGPKPD